MFHRGVCRGLKRVSEGAFEPEGKVKENLAE
jgi:hypothetical protein